MEKQKAKGSVASENKQGKPSANVCAWASDYTCLRCRWFDGRYHGGYCDYNRTDTNPDGYCSYFKAGS